MNALPPCADAPPACHPRGLARAARPRSMTRRTREKNGGLEFFLEFPTKVRVGPSHTKSNIFVFFLFRSILEIQPRVGKNNIPLDAGWRVRADADGETSNHFRR